MRTRLWICDTCGIIYRRYLSGPHARPHQHCGTLMRSARVYPDSEWYKRMAKKKERKQSEVSHTRAHFSRVWNSEGKILQVSTETRRTWRAVEALQLRGSPFIKRAKTFLLSLRKDLGQFGSQGVPEVVFETVPGCEGIYQRHALKGLWRIALRPERTISEIRSTFLHEVLHWIDDQSESHPRFGKLPGDHYQFEERLADLSIRLGVNTLIGTPKGFPPARKERKVCVECFSLVRYLGEGGGV